MEGGGKTLTTFVALYRGKTIAEARLIAVSADPDLVNEVSTHLLNAASVSINDPVIQRLEHGRVAAMQLLKKEASEES
jgi:hypothetical protein